MVFGVLLLVVLAGGVVWFVKGGGKADSPEAAVNTFYTASRNNDAGQLRSVLCQDDLASIGDASGQSLLIGATNPRVRLGDLTIVGSRQNGSVVQVQVHLDVFLGRISQGVDLTIPVIQEGGGYKVCLSRDVGTGPVYPGD